MCRNANHSDRTEGAVPHALTIRRRQRETTESPFGERITTHYSKVAKNYWYYCLRCYDPVAANCLAPQFADGPLRANRVPRKYALAHLRVSPNTQHAPVLTEEIEEVSEDRW